MKKAAVLQPFCVQSPKVANSILAFLVFLDRFFLDLFFCCAAGFKSETHQYFAVFGFGGPSFFIRGAAPASEAQRPREKVCLSLCLPFGRLVSCDFVFEVSCSKVLGAK